MRQANACLARTGALACAHGFNVYAARCFTSSRWNADCHMNLLPLLGPLPHPPRPAYSTMLSARHPLQFDRSLFASSLFSKPSSSLPCPPHLHFP
eukprot:1143588-Pleurochrysis_carterae.AAC.1